MEKEMVIDHVGIAVRSIQEGLDLWTKVLGYRQLTEVILNTRQKVKVVFLGKSGSVDIKLLEPTDPSSAVFYPAQKGRGLHHLCFRCRDVATELVRLQGAGLRVITRPEPGEAFLNEKIAFVYAGQGLNIELIDTEKRAGRIDP